MGAGASAGTEEGRRKKPKAALPKEMPSRDKHGTALGPEFSCLLVRPEFGTVKPGTAIVLRIAYEALVFMTADKQPLTHFIYQDVICWGSNAHVFQFKVFGYVFGLPKSQYVPIMLRTPDGKEIERKTLSAVRSLMADMDRVAMSKDDFNLLKQILQPATEQDLEAASEPEESWIAGRVETIKQFGAQKRFTANQAVEMMTLLKLWQGSNPCDAFGQSFDMIDLVVFLFGNILNPDSFQLLLNVFDDKTDRENIIMRLHSQTFDDHRSVDMAKRRRQSLALLNADCPEGLGMPGQTAGQAGAYSRQIAHVTGHSDNPGPATATAASIITSSHLPRSAATPASPDTGSSATTSGASVGEGGAAPGDPLEAEARRLAEDFAAAEAQVVAESADMADAREAQEAAEIAAAIAAVEKAQANEYGAKQEPVGHGTPGGKDPDRRADLEDKAPTNQDAKE